MLLPTEALGIGRIPEGSVDADNPIPNIPQVKTWPAAEQCHTTIPAETGLFLNLSD